MDDFESYKRYKSKCPCGCSAHCDHSCNNCEYCPDCECPECIEIDRSKGL